MLEFDLLQGQLQELFCIRSLKRTDGIVESRDFIAENSQYGNWVFYPWSKVALRILEKREFVELRTSRNRNKITKIENKFDKYTHTYNMPLASRCCLPTKKSLGW